jgi:predicted transcriptional regulator
MPSRPPAALVAAPAKRGGSRRKPGWRKGSGARGAQALDLLQAQPGITIPELAEKMGIKQNYLYRVLPGLEQDGRVEKKGRGWYPKATSKVA